MRIVSATLHCSIVCRLYEEWVYLLFGAQLWISCESEDIVGPAGEEMSTKRKAESHSRAASRPRIMKSGDSQVDSERDSGFSGWTPAPTTFLHIQMIRNHLLEPHLLIFLVYRCKLRAHEHDGHHRLGGFTPPWFPVLGFRVPGLSTDCGWGLLLQPLSHDHHEQRPPQTGTSLLHNKTLTL